MPDSSHHLNKEGEQVSSMPLQAQEKYLKGRGAENEEDDHETECTVLCYSPKWLQFLASKKTYVLGFGILGMSNMAMGAYFSGTISTMEKRFRIPSTKTGIIASALELGVVVSVIFLSYFGGTGHKPRWLAVGGIILAASCFMRYIPHALFGPGQVAQSLSSGKILCNSTVIDDEICNLESEGLYTFLIFLLSFFIFGIGCSTYETLGNVYLDDNTRKNKMPFMFSLSVIIRSIGPTFGFLLASYTLKIYIDTSASPSYNSNDPRWLGAWWMGWIPLSIIHVILSLMISMFPKTLPREADRRLNSATSKLKQRNKKSLKDFLDTVKRLIVNPILMMNSFSSLFYIIGLSGYWMFMPKYIETIFRVPAHESNFVQGTVSGICLGFGMLLSGAILSYLRPRPTYLASWNVFTEALDTLGHLIFVFLGCSKFDLHGQPSDSSYNLISDCNIGCQCPFNLDYQPICSSDESTTFFSPCHAGCLNSYENGSAMMYTNCSCIGDGYGFATEGICPTECKGQYYFFITVLIIMKFLSVTGRTGNTLIQFRSVEPQDKALSIAVTEVLLCGFAYLPAPILFGYLLDSSCIVWGYSCKEKGNCWLYDADSVRYLLNFTSAGFLLIATLLDVGVLMKVSNLQIYDEDDEK